MRILFWAETYLPLLGGVQVFAHNLGTALARRGHECHLITNQFQPYHPSTEDDGGMTIHRLPFLDAFRRQDLGAIVQIRRAIQEIRSRLQPEVEHVHFNGPILRLQQMPSSAVAPRLVATLHLLVEQVTGSPAVQTALRTSRARLIALSQGGLHSLRTHAPDLAPQLVCINNSAPEPRIPHAPLPWDPPRFLAGGRLVPEKGFDIALHAFARIAGLASRPEMTITGDGPERSNLDALAASLGVADRVHFAGWTPPGDIPRQMNEATIVLMPSRWKEPFGLVALEAAQMGRPVIASNTGGLPDIVSDSVTGRLVPPEDPIALARAMTELLSDLPRLRQMGHAARDRARTEFDFERSIDQHLALYGS